MMTTDTAVLDTEKSTRAIWIQHVTVLAVLLLGLGAAYWAAIEAAVEVWWVSPTFSHCFLIIPISLYLIWNKRHQLTQMTPRAFPIALAAIIPFVLTWYVGHIVAVNEVQQFSIMAMAQILILAVLGPAVYRVILFPALYLFFLVPTGEYLIRPLQTFTTHFINAGLNVCGIPHYTEGTIIELVTGRYEVEEACAGLRFLIATIALGVLFVHLTYRKWHKIVIFMLASFIVPVIGNGFRALGIVLLAYFSDNKIAVGFDHIVYGWGFSVAILLFLFFIGSRFRDENVEPSPKVIAGPPSNAGLLITAVIAVLVVSSGPALAYWERARAYDVNSAALQLPSQLGEYVVGEPTGQWQPKYGEPAARMAVSLTVPQSFSPPVDAFVYYYLGSNKGHTLVESTNRLWDEHDWNAVARSQISTHIGPTPVAVNELVLSAPYQHRLVWSVYWAGGKFTTSGMDVRLARLKSMFYGGNGAALVAVSTPIEGVTLNGARSRLSHALAAMNGLPSRLQQVKANRQ